MKRKLLCLLVCVAMLITAMPLFTHAESNNFIYIGGIEVDKTDKDVFGDGKVAFDAENGILYLNGYDGQGIVSPVKDDTVAGIYSSGDITVVLSGNNKIFNEIPAFVSAGILVDGTLTVKGEGSLLAADYCAEGYSYGICAASIIFESGTVEAVSGIVDEANANGESSAVYAEGTVSVTGADVKCTAGSAGLRSCGINSEGFKLVSGKICTAADIAEYSFGLRSNGDVVILGGQADFNAGDNAKRSYGIHLIGTGSRITVSGGKLEAHGGANAEITSSGIRTSSETNGAAITGGYVVCTGDNFGYDADNGPVLSRRAHLTAIGKRQSFATSMIFGHPTPYLNNPNFVIKAGQSEARANIVENADDFGFRTPYTDIEMTVKFGDVAEDAWYNEAVYYCSERDYMNGTSETQFSPDADVTRAMFVQIIAKLGGIDLDAYAEKQSFKDVASGTWYHNAVEWAKESGVTEGVGNGYFAPDSLVTREQMTVFLRAFARKCGCDVSITADLSGYTDSGDISPWAVEAMQWAIGSGIISGVTETTLSPLMFAKRSHVAVMVMNFDTLILNH